jgi:hypothetical protein
MEPPFLNNSESLSLKEIPSEIKASILFNYLDINDISNCYKASKIFNCLNQKQLNIIKHVRKGWIMNIREGNLDVCKYLYKMSIRSGSPIDIHSNNKKAFTKSCNYGHAFSLLEKAFINSCNYGHLEICKWLYKISIKSGSPIDIHINEETPFIYSCLYGHLEICKWLYDLGIENNSSIDINSSVLATTYCGGHIEILKWLVSLPPKKYKLYYKDDGKTLLWCLRD